MEWHAPPEDLNLSNPLWDLALALWNRPGFAETCLEAQNAGIAVTHILAAVYSAQSGFAWDGKEPKAIGAWRREATESLRRFRQSLSKENPAVAPLRQQIAESELASEQVELAWWWHHLGTMDSGSAHADLHPVDRARHNLVLIGLDGELAPLQDRIIDAWKQTPEQDQPTGKPE
ncbi:uncharacterized protein (TIGR02444 family) [Halospina denitrificans]|uniref:Uncharacterized protein (TIGR02444 family) n=1 Tax=Halospina denitrificans TaxID=332522 RepID=A0A4R7K2L5_9GAMM|nr:DUF2390 domain-containing protein [Halospina denitrificans]TDT44307.1 uncharacterized protein (TIGR02444 family) [Halospina denitrificans]